MRLEVPSHCIEHLDQQRIAQRIEDLIPLLSTDDKLLGAQHREMLRHVGRFNPDAFEDRTHRECAISKALDDLNPCGVSERLKHLGLESPQLPVSLAIGASSSHYSHLRRLESLCRCRARVKPS